MMEVGLVIRVGFTSSYFRFVLLLLAVTQNPVLAEDLSGKWGGQSGWKKWDQGPKCVGLGWGPLGPLPKIKDQLTYTTRTPHDSSFRLLSILQMPIALSREGQVGQVGEVRETVELELLGQGRVFEWPVCG